MPVQDESRPSERWCLLVCHPDVAEPPAEGASKGDDNGQSGSSVEEEPDTSSSLLDYIQATDEESEPSEEEAEAARPRLSHGEDFEDSARVEDWEQNSEHGDSLAPPHSHDIKESSPSCSCGDTKYTLRGENIQERSLICHQRQRQSDDTWRLAKEMMADSDGDIKQTGQARGQRYEREMHPVLLRTCRQIYAEANQVLWETNVFSFNDVPSFTRFMSSRSGFQKRLIKKLRLAMNWLEDVDSWDSVLSMALMRSLQGLRELWLLINHSAWRAKRTKSEIDSLLVGHLKGSTLPGVRKLASLPLQQVNVRVVYDPSCQDLDERNSDPAFLWTAEDRQDYAKRLRDRPLDPNGAEVWAKYVEELEWSRYGKPWRERLKQETSNVKTTATHAQ